MSADDSLRASTRLILHDMLGINERTPKHAKRYAELGEIISNAVRTYAREVVAGEFPTDGHSFHRPGGASAHRSPATGGT